MLRPVLGPPRLEDADGPHRHDAAGKGRFQIEDYDIERVAVLGAGLGDEAEVMRKAQPGRESTADAERAESSVVLVLVAASRRGVDHCTDTCGTPVPWRQLIWCRRRLHSATASGRSSRSSWKLRRPAPRQCEREMLKGVHNEGTFRVRRGSCGSRLLIRLRLKGAHSRRGRRRPLSSPAASRCRRVLIGPGEIVASGPQGAAALGNPETSFHARLSPSQRLRGTCAGRFRKFPLDSRRFPMPA